MIDAAFRHDGLNCSYFFSGSQCVRFNGSSTRVAAGYPRPIAEDWHGLPDDFQQGVDAVARAQGNTYFFKDNQYVRFDGNSTTMNTNGHYPARLPGGWGGLPSDFLEGIDAALRFDGHTYLFSDDQCVRYTDPIVSPDPGFPKSIDEEWLGLPNTFSQGINAALHHAGNTYFFSGDEYVAFKGNSHTKANNYPLLLPGGWQGLPPEFSGNGSRLLFARLENDNLVVEYPDGRTVPMDQLFELLPGAGVNLRCATQGLIVQELRIYQDPGHGGKGVRLHTLSPGDGVVFHEGDASARCHQRGILLVHRHAVGGEAQYYFGLTLSDGNQPYVWDPEVHDEKGGGGRFTLRKRS